MQPEKHRQPMKISTHDFLNQTVWNPLCKTNPHVSLFRWQSYFGCSSNAGFCCIQLAHLVDVDEIQLHLRFYVCIVSANNNHGFLKSSWRELRIPLEFPLYSSSNCLINLLVSHGIFAHSNITTPWKSSNISRLCTIVFCFNCCFL